MEGLSSSRSNPIPQEDKPNLHPAALNFTTMKRALESEVAEERPRRLCVCVIAQYRKQEPPLPCLDLPDSTIFKREHSMLGLFVFLH